MFKREKKRTSLSNDELGSQRELMRNLPLKKRIKFNFMQQEKEDESVDSLQSNNASPRALQELESPYFNPNFYLNIGSNSSMPTTPSTTMSSSPACSPRPIIYSPSSCSPNLNFLAEFARAMTIGASNSSYNDVLNILFNTNRLKERNNSHCNY